MSLGKGGTGHFTRSAKFAATGPVHEKPYENRHVVRRIRGLPELDFQRPHGYREAISPYGVGA